MGAVQSMALCVASLIGGQATSLLTPVAVGFGATDGQTRQAISIAAPQEVENGKIVD